MDAPLPDYYRTLGVEARATASEIKEAYKRRSLKTHPDRFPNATPAERQRYTQKFQTLADAYYVLSDTQRRREYDELRSSRPSSNSFFSGGVDSDDDEAASEYSEKEQSYSANFFQSFFPGAFKQEEGQEEQSYNASHDARRGSSQPAADGVFANVFEELLRPEVHRVAPVWKYVGGASGTALGFIVGNIPGALAGAFAGSQLGRIRDAKGKSVAEVFMGLGASQRAEAKRTRANAEARHSTRVFPGYNKRLPAAAQAVVEQALLDNDLANADADDPRWTQLYDELDALIHRSHEVPAPETPKTHTGSFLNDDDDEGQYEWGSCSEDGCEAQVVNSHVDDDEARQAQEAYARTILPKADLATALHGAVSDSLSNSKTKGKGKAKGSGGESGYDWDPSSLAALTMLCEEIALSQATFSARRSMFAKQASKASKKKQRRLEQQSQPQPEQSRQ
ncbi:uncharacterized protein PSANT_04421 [Moesziomyces antarcticus]|uniref:J domain-containing protein n=1 Tax=Pseudozyma antarctica TaxID=84753 RepID=A0A5C3FSJ3_PSEA2|nr:uncharacterized protein PSANT_04421 [Moesziomyces antarcticus]